MFPKGSHITDLKDWRLPALCFRFFLFNSPTRPSLTDLRERDRKHSASFLRCRLHAHPPLPRHLELRTSKVRRRWSATALTCVPPAAATESQIWCRVAKKPSGNPSQGWPRPEKGRKKKTPHRLTLAIHPDDDRAAHQSTPVPAQCIFDIDPES